MSVDTSALELVRAGLITYKQLNEVHKLIQETGGGDLDLHSALVERGYLTEEQLQGRRGTRRRSPKKRLKLTYSLDLVKAGLLSFKQLNECHREARESKGEKNVLDVAVEKGFVTELQLATLPQEGTFAAQEKHNKRFSSSWDLFRAGLVSLKALNECHRQIKVDSPNKSLKEALIERGYISRDQVSSFEAHKDDALAKDEDAGRSSFMERYKDELAKIPADLRERLRREHLISRGLLAPEEAAAEEAAAQATAEQAAQVAPKKKKKKKTKRQAPPTAVDIPPRAAAPVSDEEELDFQSSQTHFDAGAEDEDADVRSARTFMDMGAGEDEEDEEDEEDARSARTFMDMGAEEDEEDEDDEEDARSARTFMDMGAGADEEDEEDDEEDEEEGDDFRAARTFMDLGGGGGGQDDDPDARSARTFMDLGAGADEDEDDEDDEDDDEEEEGEDLRAARTFMDLSESSEGEDVRAARTFMDLGGGDEEDEEEDDEEEEGDDFR
ncbi:MAG: hypothetical protein AB7N76_05020, partial [Planctomycetota bacterium]